MATLSTGEKIAAPRLERASEERLATAQRARKMKRTRGSHRKVVNRRKDFLQEPSAHRGIRHHYRWRCWGRATVPFPSKERARCRLGELQGYAGV